MNSHCFSGNKVIIIIIIIMTLVAHVMFWVRGMVSDHGNCYMDPTPPRHTHKETHTLTVCQGDDVQNRPPSGPQMGENSIHLAHQAQ